MSDYSISSKKFAHVRDMRRSQDILGDMFSRKTEDTEEKNSLSYKHGLLNLFMSEF